MDPPPGEPATVCLVDTGVDLNPDVEGNVIGRVALDGGDGGDVWDRKHGTLMAMMMGAPINNWGTVGAWPYVRIVSVRAMPSGATGFPFNAYSKGIEACLNWTNVRIINLSFSGPRPSDADVARLDDYIARARINGVSVVAGAGNRGGDVEWPAADHAVLAVAAAGPDRSLCDFSARGPEVLVAAPGCGLELADPATGMAASYAGTSPAAAFASTVLAALYSYRPDLTASQGENLLRTTAAEGVLDVTAALRAAGLGAAVDAAAARVPTRSTLAAPSDQNEASTPRSQLTVGALGPEFDLPADDENVAQWPAPRLRGRRCSARTAIVWLRNRPSGVVVTVRLYKRRGEFSARLLQRLSARRSSVRIKRGYDYLSLQYTGRGRDRSQMVRSAVCGKAH